MRLTRNGKFPSGEYFGQTSLAPFHDWEPLLSQSVTDQLKVIKQGLDNTSIQLNVPYVSP